MSQPESQEARHIGAPIYQLVILFVVGGLLCGWQLMSPVPFADGYHHWFSAAKLVDSGRFWELFSSPDGAWPPLYTLAATIPLLLFGEHALWALQLQNISLHLLNTYLLYRYVTQLSPSKLSLSQVSTQQIALLSATLYCLSPLVILTASMPSMEPLAICLVLLHLLFASKHSWLSGLLLALACLTRYEAWGYLAIALLLDPKRFSVRYLLATVVCLVWLWAAGLSALYEKLHPEATRTHGESLALGAMLGRALVALQTFVLALSPILGAALQPMSSPSLLPKSIRSFALCLLWLVFLTTASGLIAGSHRYLLLAMPFLAVLAAETWLTISTKHNGIVWLPVGCFSTALLVALGQWLWSWELGMFWLYVGRVGLLLALLVVITLGVLISRYREQTRVRLVTASTLLLGAVYLPVLSQEELGKYIAPFRAVGEVLSKEPNVGLVLLDNPIPAYYSNLPVRQLLMANRERGLQDLFEPTMLSQLATQTLSSEDLQKTLASHHVTHIVSEEVTYLFTRSKLLPLLAGPVLRPYYWNRGVLGREVTLFQLRLGQRL